MRIKQDAVPGLTIPVWFDSDTAGKYELVCAELCGWGHYKMRGNVTVHDDQTTNSTKWHATDARRAEPAASSPWPRPPGEMIRP